LKLQDETMSSLTNFKILGFFLLGAWVLYCAILTFFKGKIIRTPAYDEGQVDVTLIIIVFAFIFILFQLAKFDY
jgi:hypothetical protein